MQNITRLKRGRLRPAGGENRDQGRSKTEDAISPKLFTVTLESIFGRLNWENKGVKIGEFLLHRNTTRITPAQQH